MKNHWLDQRSDKVTIYRTNNFMWRHSSYWSKESITVLYDNLEDEHKPMIRIIDGRKVLFFNVDREKYV